jgi:predicted secreted protein
MAKNRQLAAKASKAKSQKVDFVRAETSKAYNYVRASDADRLTGAIAARPNVVAVQGRDVRRVAMLATDYEATVTVGDASFTVTKRTEKSQSMRQYLRSMF